MDTVSLREKVGSWKQTLSREIARNEKLKQVEGFYQDIITRQYWQQLGPSLVEECRSSFHSVFAFGKGIGWWRIVLYFSSYALVLALAIVLPLQHLTGWAAQYSGVGSCRPDGTFDLSADYDLWEVTGIFQITMGFGPLSFSNAKLVDAVWDVVVGRGFQAVLALIAYKVTTKSLVMSMEQVSVPIGTFEAVTLQDSTFMAFYKQVRNFLSVKTWQHQLRIAWIILSTLFIVAFPTLASAMTGYAPVTDAFLGGQGGRLIPFASYEQVRYIIHDADRIGLDKPLPLNDVPEDSTDPMTSTIADICVKDGNIPFQPTPDGLVPDWRPSIDERCRMIWHVREYVKEYGFLGLNQTQSTFNKSGEMRNLSAPILNIEAVQHSRSSLAYSSSLYYSYGLSKELRDAVSPEYSWRRPENSASAFSDSIHPAKYTLAGTNDILTSDEVNQLGSCQQTATYRWGFSFLLLFILLILFLIWIIGTYVLWLDVFLHSRFDIAKRDMGLYRAALDISSVIHSELDKDVDSLTPNRVLEKVFQGDKKRARIGLQSAKDALPSNTRMMAFQAWGRTGGYSRWIPRATLVFLLALFVVPPFFLSNPYTDQSIMITLLILVAPMIFINILVLGNRKWRTPRRERRSQAEDGSQHPLQPFHDDDRRSPGVSMLAMSTITTSPRLDHDATNGHAREPSKTPASTTVDLT